MAKKEDQGAPSSTSEQEGATRDAVVLRDEGGHRIGDVITLTEDEITAGEASGWLDGHPAAVAAAKGA